MIWIPLCNLGLCKYLLDEELWVEKFKKPLCRDSSEFCPNEKSGASREKNSAFKLRFRSLNLVKYWCRHIWIRVYKNILLNHIDEVLYSGKPPHYWGFCCDSGLLQRSATLLIWVTCFASTLGAICTGETWCSESNCR